jgi:hypothetical protein
METLRLTKHYAAYLSPETGLIVQSFKKQGGGVRMMLNHPQAQAYTEAFKTCFDDDDFNNLCRALLS